MIAQVPLQPSFRAECCPTPENIALKRLLSAGEVNGEYLIHGGWGFAGNARAET